MAYSMVDWLYFSGARGTDGLPVASGTVNFYAPGSTSELVQVYADATGTPLAQPVTLDAAGRAAVYTNSPVEVLVKDAFGATVRTSTRSIAVISDQVAVNWESATKTLTEAIADIAAFMATYSNSPAVDTYDYEQISTQNPVFTLHTSYTQNFKRAMYSGDSATVTLNLPPGFIVASGARFLVSFSNEGPGTVAALSFGSGIKASALTNLLTGKTASAQFAGNPSGIWQVTAWYVS